MYRYYSLFSGCLLIMVFTSCKDRSENPEKLEIKADYKFPKDWLGYWEGDLFIYNEKGINMELKVALDIAEQVNDSLYQWTLKYITDENIDERKYFLVKGEGQDNHWVTNENNGILLDGYVLDNCLYTLFDVGNNRIQTSYKREGHHMLFQNLVSRTEGIRISGDVEKDSLGIPPVNSYMVSGLQKATLIKADKNDH